MTPVSVSKDFIGTWCGAPGVQFTLHFDKRNDGKRVVVTSWTDKQLVEVRAIRGDGRAASFCEFAREQFTYLPQWRDRAAVIARQLAAPLAAAAAPHALHAGDQRPQRLLPASGGGRPPIQRHERWRPQPFDAGVGVERAVFGKPFQFCERCIAKINAGYAFATSPVQRYSHPVTPSSSPAAG